MKYSEVLSAFKPTETGNFMFRYSIKGREYILFSPVDGQVSCLELSTFKELTPFQLMILIQAEPKKEEETKEFSFEFPCDRDKLISYLFDVSEQEQQEGKAKVRRVSNNKCYFLYRLKPANKIRNLFQFSHEDGSQLVFGNTLCLASIHDDTPTGTLNVCWNPATFNLLERKSEHNPAYLLPSSNPILCASIFQKAEEQKARINMFVDDESGMDALMFLSYIIENKGIEKAIPVYFDGQDITIQMKNFPPVTVVNFMAKAQKSFNEQLRKKYGESESLQIFQLDAVGTQSFISFPKNDIAISTMLKHLIMAFKLEDISCSEI